MFSLRSIHPVSFRTKLKIFTFITPMIIAGTAVADSGVIGIGKIPARILNTHSTNLEAATLKKSAGSSFFDLTIPIENGQVVGRCQVNENLFSPNLISQVEDENGSHTLPNDFNIRPFKCSIIKMGKVKKGSKEKPLLKTVRNKKYFANFTMLDKKFVGGIMQADKLYGLSSLSELQSTTARSVAKAKSEGSFAVVSTSKGTIAEALAGCGTHPESKSLTHELEILPQAAYAATASETKKVIELAMIADYEYWKLANYNNTQIFTDMTAVVNGAYGWYESQLGITLKIVFRKIYTEAPPNQRYKVTSWIEDGRDEFANNQGVDPGVNYDHAHLFTGRNFSNSGSAIGISYIGYICSYPMSVSLSKPRAPSTFQAAITLFAHELGHNLGATHDTSCVANDSKIMCPLIYPSGNTFSLEAKNLIAPVANNAGCINEQITPNPTPVPTSTGPVLTAPSNMGQIDAPGTLQLVWTDRSNGETGFLIEASNIANFPGSNTPIGFQEVGRVAANVAYFNAADIAIDHMRVIPGRAYLFRVKALGPPDSAYSDNLRAGIVITQATPVPSREPIKLVAPANFGQMDKPGSLFLVWTDRSDGESGFAIEASKIDNSTGVERAIEYKAVATAPANTTSYNATRIFIDGELIRPGMAYMFRIKALGPPDSAYSSSLRAGIVIPEPPRILTAPAYFGQTAAPGSLLLVWTDRSDGESGFAIEASKIRILEGKEMPVGFQEVARVGANVTNYNATRIYIDGKQILPGEAFLFRIKAVGPPDSAYSDTLRAGIVIPTPVITPTFTPTATATTTIIVVKIPCTNPVNKYDVNGDGMVTLADHTALTAWLSKYAGTTPVCTTKFYPDVNGSGTTTALDLNVLGNELLRLGK